MKRGQAPSRERRRDQSPLPRELRRDGLGPPAGELRAVLTQVGESPATARFLVLPPSPCSRRLLACGIYGARGSRAVEGEAGESRGKALRGRPCSGPQAVRGENAVKRSCLLPLVARETANGGEDGQPGAFC